MSKLLVELEDFDNETEGFVVVEKEDWDNYKERLSEYEGELSTEVDGKGTLEWNDFFDVIKEETEITDEESSVIQKFFGNQIGEVYFPDEVETGF